MSSQLPSNWITQHTPPLTADHEQALDLACGNGRHSFWLADQGWQVTAIDRDLSHTDTTAPPAITWIEDDLEAGYWPLGGKQFDLIVVTNYLHRPLFDHLRTALRPGGSLIYETFMIGNAQYGRPRSPEFLLNKEELRMIFSDWDIQAFEQGPVYLDDPAEITAVKQSIVAQKPAG